MKGMLMGASRLDRRISIQRATESRDDTGAVVRDFADWIERPSYRRDLTGREALQNQQAVAIRECVYEVRHDSDTRTITAGPGFRVVDGAQTFDVVALVDAQLARGRRNTYIGLRVRGRGEAAA